MCVTIFSRRVVNPWNNLPIDTDFSSLARFKAALKRANLLKVLTYCVVRIVVSTPHGAFLSFPVIVCDCFYACVCHVNFERQHSTNK